MMYRVTICETIAQEFTIEAESKEDALLRAKYNYKEGTFVVDNPTVLDVEITLAEDN